MTDTPLYDADILAWTEQQAAVLRELGRTRRDLPNGLDLENIIEEIEALGRSELRTAESFLRLILAHLIKAVSDPDAWRAEAANWRLELIQALSPSMHRRIDMDAIWKRALYGTSFDLEAHGRALPPGLAGPCPVTLDDLLSDDFDLRRAASDLTTRLIRAAS